MRAVQKHLGIAWLLCAYAIAQSAGTAAVQKVSASPEGSGVRVEITLTAPVIPSADTASDPERILLDFPGTTCGAQTENVTVNVDGVRRVRTAQHSTNPFVTRMVVDLDQAHQYTLRSEGNRVILTLGPAESAHRKTHGAPVAATSGNLIGVFHRKRESIAGATADNNASVPLPAPPPAVAPATGPLSTGVKQNTTPAPPASVAAPASTVTADAKPETNPVPPTSVAQSPTIQRSFDQNQVITATKTNAPATETAAAVTTTPKPEPETPNAATTEAPAPSAPTEVVKIASENAATSPKVEAAPPVTAPLTGTPANPSNAAPESTLIARSDDPSLRTVFRVKYVAEGVAYLEGGRAQGLTEGMKLEIEDSNLPAKQGDSASANDPRVVAELVVSAVAETSAVTDIQAPKRPVKVGDLAYLSSGDADALVQQRALSATRQYPAVISFTEGDTLEEEALAVVPRPPLPSVNRARGRIGLDTMETISHGTSSVTSTDVGIAFRGDITRIGGTFWNLSGYWRGRLTKESAASQQTLQSVINRTYHMNMTYDNPNSTLVAGFGRLYLPWAPSLDTIDGGYFGKKLSPGVTLGVFGGSTPDPSSWDYSPDRVISGAFVNFEGGGYEGFHYTSTQGAGISMVNWAIDRPFIFFEDSVSYKRTISVYESAQLDNPRGNSATPSPGPGLGRNFFTVRVDPVQRLELSGNYNYFRDIPTFDPTLVGTGLLDKYLFQGFSAGARVEVVKQIWISALLGRSSGTGDAKSSLNEMYGLTFGRLPFLKLRADAHYSRFNSSFGNGSYESLSLSRQMSDRLRLEVLVGQQNFASTLTANNRARFVTGTVETTLGPHYYLQGIFTTNRGDLSYDQLMFSMGYRFDSKRRGE